ncbi:iron-sulfur cluster assembly accessory protein [Brevundimonas diminuta]|uniref:Iron-sulfur cluster assembly accessory protein n=1 Tax=Brevundimonas diminuta TaxID=293 RepID=A0A410NW84_BREDI|nr:iron-sulfur cluster assembly accessory protein [Brevundimonas diminuta]QAT14140.1 iron-sulfur cluster assembly accessory protein [Brevundimonas diminuta]GEB99898.1 heme biosynthesis protein HemY [Brevundimonas diminuta]
MSTVQSTESARDLSLSVATRSPEGITLAESGARRLARLSEAEGKPVLLRVAVDGGGCSGFQYRFELVDGPEADDLVVRRDGQAVVIDPVSIPFLKDSEIAFVDELAGAQFVIRNPNAASSCGCGVSFAI